MFASPARTELDALFPAGGALAGRLFHRILVDDDAPMPYGTRIGCWRIGDVLGRGGSSVVYLAERADGHFEQQAALKVVRPQAALIERFRRERQILAKLRHPSIARLIDGGQLDDGRLWLAMEPVLGERIDDYVRSRRLSLDARVALFEAVCDAVAYAHERSLIHRDLKPGNLLVDESGRPRLIDFGIASSGEPEADGIRAMTPIYASPEQRAGDAVTAASDIYQLGVLLRLMLMPAGASCETLPRKLPETVKARIQAIVTRATATDPAQRHVSVIALRGEAAAIGRRDAASIVADGRSWLARRWAGRALFAAISA